MRIEQVMSRPVHVCRPSDTLERAAQLMWHEDCGAILVVDDGGKLIGVVTDRDICMAAYTQGRPLSSLGVQSTMSEEVVSLGPGDEVEDAQRLMGAKRIHRIPVVDERGCPVGIASLEDFARSAVRSGNREGSHTVAQTLASICEPQHTALERARSAALVERDDATVPRR